MSTRTIGILGATGAVGQEIMTLLEERQAPVGQIRLFSSSRSAGKSMSVCRQEVVCEVLKPGCFDGVDVLLCSAGADISREWSPQALEAGALVIDNSSAFRMQDGTPLVHGDTWLMQAKLVRGSLVVDFSPKGGPKVCC